jgi:phytoene desaturase
VSDFEREYYSYRGNAYGLANTLRQTAFMKPSMRHRKIKNLMFAGQLTMPGPGLPPSMLSGNMAARMLIKSLAS